MENGTDTQVFDGATNFLVWQARVENELLRRGLLGYVEVRDYDGSQSFTYQGEHLPPKCPAGLSHFEAMREAAEAMHIVQHSLDEHVEAAVLNKNVFDVWATLRAMYGSGREPAIFEQYRALIHMWYGEKDGQSL